jgi:hypothetical protein
VLFLLLAVFPGFNYLLSALISSKRKSKDYFPGPALNQREPFLLFKSGDFPAISRILIVRFKIVTPHVGCLKILRRLAYTTGKSYLFLSMTKGHHQLNPILWTSILSLKIANCREYLEAGLSGSMRNSMIHSACLRQAN